MSLTVSLVLIFIWIDVDWYYYIIAFVGGLLVALYIDGGPVIRPFMNKWIPPALLAITTAVATVITQRLLE